MRIAHHRVFFRSILDQLWVLDHNSGMPKVANKPPRKSRSSPPTTRRKRSMKTSANVVAPVAEDAAERKRIGETLDVAAFMAHHKGNPASAAHWETAE